MPLLDGIKVLLLDDDADTREELSAGLEQQGAQVIEAASAQAALLHVEEDRPDIVIAEVEMPEVDGWGFVRAMRKLGPERGGRTPAVALTDHNTPEDRIRSVTAGFVLHVAKPLAPAQLGDLIVAVLQTHPQA
jgi:CheY-like chemotaxis protein